jgi:3-oxoacyl-[acyl-carrier protein] reductase
LASEGATVVVHYATDSAAAAQTVAAIRASGGDAFAARADFNDEGAVSELFTAVEQMLPDRPLDILVNNAGVLDATPFGDVSAAHLDRTYAINVRAPFLVTQQAARRLRDGGRIINISSAVTRVASTFFHYTMSKSALEAMTLTLAQALAPRAITVNAVRPGVTETDMGQWVDALPGLRDAIVRTIALGRLGTPGDVADVVAFLASDDARFVTGVMLDAGGGTWLGPKVA